MARGSIPRRRSRARTWSQWIRNAATTGKPILFTEFCPIDIDGDGRIDQRDLCRRVRVTAYASDDHDPVSALRFEWTISDETGEVDVIRTTVPTIVYDFPLGNYDVSLVAFDSTETSSDTVRPATEAFTVITFF
jgi:hypothetical protein